MADNNVIEPRPAEPPTTPPPDLDPLGKPAGTGKAPRPASVRPARPVTRRELLAGVAVGGAALVATNLSTGMVTHRVSTYVADTRAATQLATTREGLETEIRRLQMQLSLYRDLERIGLDQIIRGVIDVYDNLWIMARKAIAVLRGGVSLIGDAIGGFEASLTTLRAATKAFSDLLSGIENRLRVVQTAIADVIDLTAPIGEAVSRFLATLLSRIPTGVTSRIREVNDRLSEMAASVADFATGTRQRLLGPLQEVWLGQAEGEGVQAGLFEPLRKKLLSPLETFLDQTDVMATSWAEQVKPVRQALVQRAEIREKIARLEREGDERLA